MRGITALVYEPSLLDPVEGIRFRGLSIPQCRKLLPKAPNGGDEPLPQATFWLLLTGNVPTQKQAQALCAELHARSSHETTDCIKNVISALPPHAHPMTAFNTGVLALQAYSKFAHAYATGKANKKNYWQYALDDALDIVARTPFVAAMVYNRTVNGKAELANPTCHELDWAANFMNMVGFKSPQFWDCMRLYFSLHADHEGGNVSAHATTLVASALSDPYLSFSAGLSGLAGPLHGLANQ